MKNKVYHEFVTYTTPDFPADISHIDESHPHYIMHPHWHSEFELIRVLEGELKITIEEREHTLKSGDAAIIAGGTVHSAKPNACVYESVWFSPSLIYVSELCRNTVKVCIDKNIFYKHSKTIDEIFNCLLYKCKGYEFDFLSGIYALFKEILLTKSSADSRAIPDSKFDKIMPAITIIEENYHSSLTLSFLAESCDMSPNYFCRLFKELTQKTPIDYINMYRINTACKMIELDNEKITDIAYNCGFNDLSYFIKIFQRHKGMSPKAYAQSIKKKRAASPISRPN